MCKSLLIWTTEPVTRAESCIICNILHVYVFREVTGKDIQVYLLQRTEQTTLK